LLFQLLHLREKVQNLSLCVWLISLKSFIHFAENGRISSFWLNNIPLCLYTTFPLFTGECQGWVHASPVVSGVQ
jgi:hypothetical protein